MAIAQEKYILPYTIHIKGSAVVHHPKIKGSQKVGTAQRSARVATLNPMHHPYNIPSYLGGCVL